MTTPANEFVLQLAVEQGIVSAEQLASARASVAAHAGATTAPPRLLDVLMAAGALDAVRIARLLAA